MKLDMYNLWIGTFAVPFVISFIAVIRYGFWFMFGV